MDLQRAARTIVDYRTDETFHTLKTDPQPSLGAKLNAVGAWLELGLSHPGTYLKAYAGPIRHWWDITANFAYPIDSDYIFTPGYMRQWSTFLTGPEYAGDAESVAARRLADITRELQPLTGTSRKPQWKADALAGVHRWARHGNPLTSMALYVTWIPLLIALALIGQAVFRKMRARKHLGICRGAAPVEAAEGTKRTGGAKRAGAIGTTEAAQGGEATESAGTVEVKGAPEAAEAAEAAGSARLWRRLGCCSSTICRCTPRPRRRSGMRSPRSSCSRCSLPCPSGPRRAGAFRPLPRPPVGHTY